MTPDEYQKQAASTAIYPGRDTVLGLAYCALGLANEAGEYLAAKDSATSHETEAEAGDVLWYVALLALELDAPLSEVVGVPRLSALPTEKSYAPLPLSAYAASIAGAAKKIIRDGDLDHAHRRVIVRDLRHALMVLGQDVDLDKAAWANVEKLRSRQERGVLGGSGDHR